jgi:hypothetical protein
VEHLLHRDRHGRVAHHREAQPEDRGAQLRHDGTPALEQRRVRHLEQASGQHLIGHRDARETVRRDVRIFERLADEYDGIRERRQDEIATVQLLRELLEEREGGGLDAGGMRGRGHAVLLAKARVSSAYSSACHRRRRAKLERGGGGPAFC